MHESEGRPSLDEQIDVNRAYAFRMRVIASLSAAVTVPSAAVVGEQIAQHNTFGTVTAIGTMVMGAAGGTFTALESLSASGEANALAAVQAQQRGTLPPESPETATGV